MDPASQPSGHRLPSVGFIIVAGGSGSRLGGPLAKQYLTLGRWPVLIWSVVAALQHPSVAKVVIVHPARDRDRVAAMLEAAGINDGRVLTCEGGASRTASVQAGLACLARAGLMGATLDAIAVHDAARPGLDHGVIDRLLCALERADGAAPVLDMADALWRQEAGWLDASLDRAGLVRVQTPQIGRASVLLDAYASLPKDAAPADDVAVLRRAGARVTGVAGSMTLEKLTFAPDFARLESLLVTDQMPYPAPPAQGPANPAGQTFVPRVGTGFDAHRFSPGAPLILCGVAIPHSHGLAGHSDADVGWHALCDAIYGALCEGDIGRAFPPSDAQWKGAASSVFLAHAAGRIAARGGRLVHCDVTLICEAPRIGPHRDTMVAATAEILGVSVGKVSIKATTTEAMGFTGRREGIAALASATIMLPEPEQEGGRVL